MRRFQVDYDQKVDVLYISFRHPQKSTDTEATDDGLLLRYAGKELVGITFLEMAIGEVDKAAILGGNTRRLLGGMRGGFSVHGTDS